MFTEDLVYEMYRRLIAGQSQRHISRDLGIHRESIREYVSRFRTAELPFNVLLSRGEFSQKFSDFCVTRKKRSSASTDQLQSYKAEITEMLVSLEVKSIHEILTYQGKITSSYSSFKRFVHSQLPSQKETKHPIRIELPPGKEIQMDYAKMGMLLNTKTGKKETVHAFLGILSYSRLPFIQFVKKQDQQSFTGSFISMFEFYDGVPEFITIDNLKTGVIRPSLHDPEINKSFLELAQHYGTFVSPARVRTPTDKGKVERSVQTARRLYKKLIVQFPDSTIDDLNRYATNWIQNEYGTKKHGTTGIEPLVAYAEEKKYLKPLPSHKFEIPIWKEVKVHPDQFIQFERCRYSVPAKFRGHSLMACKSGNVLRLFSGASLVKEHIVTGHKVVYDKTDFPEVVREMMNGNYAGYILRTSKKFGELSHDLIHIILETDGYLHTRQAQGILRLIEEFFHNVEFESVMREAIHKKIRVPAQLKKMFEEYHLQNIFDFAIPRSELGEKMVRSSDYYFKN